MDLFIHFWNLLLSALYNCRHRSLYRFYSTLIFLSIIILSLSSLSIEKFYLLSQWIFWLNFLVMVPLASILGDFTEEAALHTNDIVGGLLNASFGNAVEVVVAFNALMNNEIRVVQASMIGSIFSNLLLVLGCCFLFGGFYHKEQRFSSMNATTVRPFRLFPSTPLLLLVLILLQ